MAEIDNKQLKFIEILLIVGGIIGGLSENPSNKVILAFFLISSLIYYFAVSKRNNEFWANKMLFAYLVSGFFSVLITYPILSGPPVWGNTGTMGISLIIMISLFILIFLNLK